VVQTQCGPEAVSKRVSRGLVRGRVTVERSVAGSTVMKKSR
jgi:hypothetical protein